MGSLHKVGLNVLMVGYIGRIQKGLTYIICAGARGWYRYQY